MKYISYDCLYAKIKRIVKYPFNFFGLEIRRIHKKNNNKYLTLPDIINDPLEALVRLRGGDNIAFYCPIEKIKIFNGFSFSKSGYHPYVEFLKEHSKISDLSIKNSLLNDYYKSWKPDKPSKAYISKLKFCNKIDAYPSYICEYFHPWSIFSSQTCINNVNRGSITEANEYNINGITTYRDGYKLHGPVSNKKLNLEAVRLTKTYKSVNKKGYDITNGFIYVTILRRREDYIFLVAGGHHRTAVMSALSYDFIPALYSFPPKHNVSAEVRVDEAHLWPKVRDKEWDYDDAVTYFNHLFDFDSRSWAMKKNLLFEQKYPQLQKK